MKKVLLIEDLSCFGKCSISVSMPTLSCMGIEVVILPTAIFSTHTGISREAIGVDFSENLDKFKRHWSEIYLEFDSIVVGYAYAKRQIDFIKKFIEDRKDSLIILDPVMADMGRLYSKLSVEYPSYISELCENSDYIIPNVTEAYLLTNKSYKLPPYSKKEMEEILLELNEKYKKNFIITGIELENNEMLSISIDANKNIYEAKTKKVHRNYSGTGDLFTAIFTGCLLNGCDMNMAIKKATNLSTKAVKISEEAGCDRLCFERILNEL